MNKLFAVLAGLMITNATFAQKIIAAPKKILQGHSNDVTQITLTAKGDLMATGSWDTKINVYDSSYNLLRTLSGHTFPITALRFRVDGKLLASGSGDNSIIIWDSTFKNSRTLEGHTDQINTLLFDRSNKYLFSGADDKILMAWDLKTGKSFRKIDMGAAVNSIAQTNDPRFIYVATASPQIKQINLTNNQPNQILIGHADVVNDIAISGTNKLLISGSNDKTARIWDLTTGKQIRVLPVDCWKVTAVAFSDDSKYAATGCNDGSVKVWEVETGKMVAQVEANGQYVKDMAFSKDKMNVLVAATLKGSTEFGLRVWPSGIEKPVVAKPTIVADSLQKTAGTVNDSLKTTKGLKPVTPAKPANGAVKGK